MGLFFGDLVTLKCGFALLVDVQDAVAANLSLLDGVLVTIPAKQPIIITWSPLPLHTHTHTPKKVN